MTALMTGGNAMIIMWNRENVTQDCAEDTTSEDNRRTEIDATDSHFHW